MDKLILQPISRISGTVDLPGSKSLSNRILLLSALAEGETRIENLLHSEDTQVMVAALRRLGVHVNGEPGGVDLKPLTEPHAEPLLVRGRGGPLTVDVKQGEPLTTGGGADELAGALGQGEPLRLHLGNAGTAQASMAISDSAIMGR